MRDLCDYFELDGNRRLEEAAEFVEQDDDATDDDRAEFERLGVHFNDGDRIMTDPYAVPEGADFPGEDDPAWDYEDDEWEDDDYDDSDYYDDYYDYDEDEDDDDEDF